MKFIAPLFGILLLSGCSTSWYLGEWTVSGVELPGVSAMSTDEASEWIGAEARYSAAAFRFREAECRDPQYDVEVWTEADLHTAYRASFSGLGIAGEAAEVLDVRCVGRLPFPGSTFIKATRDSGYVPWEGAFFRLKRKSD